MAGRQVAENDNPWLKHLLATFYGETDHFKDPRLLLDVAHKIQLRQKLAPQTMITYLACLKKFINYLVMLDGINGSGILATVGIAKASFSSAAASESRQKATDRFKRVPSHGMVVKRHGQVIGILHQNLEEEFLLLKEEKSLNFFLMQCRLKCRSQPILLLTWTALVEIKQKGYNFDQSTQNWSILRCSHPCARRSIQIPGSFEADIHAIAWKNPRSDFWNQERHARQKFGA